MWLSRITPSVRMVREVSVVECQYYSARCPRVIPAQADVDASPARVVPLELVTAAARAATFAPLGSARPCDRAEAVKLLLLLQLLTSKNCARTNPRPRHPEVLCGGAPHVVSSCPRVGRTPIENDPLTQDWPQVRRLRTSRIRVRCCCCRCSCRCGETSASLPWKGD